MLATLSRKPASARPTTISVSGERRCRRSVPGLMARHDSRASSDLQITPVGCISCRFVTLVVIRGVMIHTAPQVERRRVKWRREGGFRMGRVRMNRRWVSSLLVVVGLLIVLASICPSTADAQATGLQQLYLREFGPFVG